MLAQRSRLDACAVDSFCAEEGGKAGQPLGQGGGEGFIGFEPGFQPEAVNDQGLRLPVEFGVHARDEAVAVENGQGVGAVDPFFDRFVYFPDVVEVKEFERTTAGADIFEGGREK